MSRILGTLLFAAVGTQALRAGFASKVRGLQMRSFARSRLLSSYPLEPHEDELGLGHARGHLQGAAHAGQGH
eukprot:scaffold16_cov242-Pinguiococcus_pyrenoidosus.AAC.2